MWQNDEKLRIRVRSVYEHTCGLSGQLERYTYMYVHGCMCGFAECM